MNLLEQAMRLDTANPSIHNDLAVALLALSETSDKPSHLLRAFQLALSAERAGLPEASFNKALALEELALAHAAARAWDSYLDRDPASDWSHEARAARDVLRGQAPSDASEDAGTAEHGSRDTQLGASAEGRRDRTRRELERLALKAWPTAHLLGDSERSLALITKLQTRALGFAAATGDRFFVDLVENLSELQSSSERSGKAGAQSVLAFFEARGEGVSADCGRSDWQALGSLVRSEAALAALVDLDLAICHYYGQTFDAALALLESLLRHAEFRSWRYLEARALWIQGLIRMVRGEFAEARFSITRALEELKGMGLTADVAAVSSLLAKAYESQGAREHAWRHRLRALSLRGGLYSPERGFSMLDESVQATRAQGYPEISLLYLEEQTRLTDGRDESLLDLAGFTHLARGDIYRRLLDDDNARRELALAESFWEQMSDGATNRVRLRRELDVAIAQSRNFEDNGLLDSLSRAIDYFEGSGEAQSDRIEIMSYLLERAGLYLDRGEVAKAEADLSRALNEGEKRWASSHDPVFQASMWEQLRQTAERMMTLELELRDDPITALEVSLRFRLPLYSWENSESERL